MHHRRAVPVQRRRSGIDQMTRHTAPFKLRSEQQPRRPGTHHEHGRTTAYALGVALLGHRVRPVVGIHHNSPFVVRL
jgi:hypothetical protein